MMGTFYFLIYVHTARRVLSFTKNICERSYSVVECLTRDRGTTGSSLTGVTALCPLARTLILA